MRFLHSNRHKAIRIWDGVVDPYAKHKEIRFLLPNIPLSKIFNTLCSFAVISSIQPIKTAIISSSLWQASNQTPHADTQPQQSLTELHPNPLERGGIPRNKKRMSRAGITLVVTLVLPHDAMMSAFFPPRSAFQPRTHFTHSIIFHLPGCC